LSARDYVIQAGLILLAAGSVVGVRYVFLRRERPRRKKATKKK